MANKSCGRGALYVRPRKVPETSEIASGVEMREVIELATQQALRAYVETARRAGVTLGVAQPAVESPASEERYQAEREEAW